MSAASSLPKPFAGFQLASRDAVATEIAETHVELSPDHTLSGSDCGLCRRWAPYRAADRFLATGLTCSIGCADPSRSGAQATDLPAQRPGSCAGYRLKRVEGRCSLRFEVSLREGAA
jgi:hypothetical protein